MSWRRGSRQPASRRRHGQLPRPFRTSHRPSTCSWDVFVGLPRTTRDGRQRRVRPRLPFRRSSSWAFAPDASLASHVRRSRAAWRSTSTCSCAHVAKCSCFRLVSCGFHRSHVLRPPGSNRDVFPFERGFSSGSKGDPVRSKGDLPRGWREMRSIRLDQSACRTPAQPHPPWPGGVEKGIEPGTFRVRKGRFDRRHWKRLKGRSSVDRDGHRRWDAQTDDAPTTQLRKMAASARTACAWTVRGTQQVRRGRVAARAGADRPLWCVHVENRNHET